MRLTRTVVPAIAVVLLTAFAATSFAQANRALQINHAVYGKEGKGKDVTNRIRAAVRNNTVDIEVDNDSMGGDPNEHTKKTLKVDYTYMGRRLHKTVNEHDRLRLP
jgi:ABC-type glycerol-3-phosphate transport system substrate-binding protein